jgi:predicted RND superfamily exporter protein
MEKLGKFIIQHKKKILLITILVSIFSIYQSSKLEIKMEITDLLPKNSQKVQNYNYALNNFDNLDITIIGAKGKKKI